MTFSKKECKECGGTEFKIVFSDELGVGGKRNSRYVHLKPVAYRECQKCGQKEVIDK